MKKLHWIPVGLCILVCSCSGSQKKSSDNNATVSVETSAEETAVLDSISEAVDKTKNEIEQTSEELDKILNEL